MRLSAIWVELAFLISVPCFTHTGRGQIPVWPDLHRDLPKILPKIFDGWATPEPVAVVDLEYLQPGPEHYCVRNHGIVMRVRVLLDLQLFLHLATVVREEGPSVEIVTIFA